MISGAQFETGSIVAGRYEVCSRIGAGGMGMVLRVLDRELNNQVVALKLLHPHLASDEHVFRRFLNEVLVARSLTHPNIVRIHDIGKAEAGFHYISMEYVDGVSLKDRITPTDIDIPANQPVPVLTFQEALSFLTFILSGVAYAHDKGVMHRDLKPANVLLSKLGEVKLADFGTARIVGMDTNLTQTGQTIGTPDYMAPEQIRGEHLDARCDVYALGIVAYELVTGKRPFVADSAVAVAFKHLNDPIGKVADPRRGIPQWYEDLVHKATAKNREERFQSAHEILGVLGEHVPEIARLAGYYSADRTGSFVGAAGTATVSRPSPAAGAGDASRTEHNIPVSQLRGQDGENSRREIRFDFKPGAEIGGKDIRFDFVHGSTDTRRGARGEQKSSGSNVKFFVIALVVLAALGGALFYLRQSSTQLATVEPGKKEDATPAVLTEDEQRIALEKELSSTIPPEESRPPQEAANKVTETTTPVVQPVMPTVALPPEVAAPTTTTPPPTEPPPPPENYSASLRLKSSSGEQLAEVVALDKLAQSSWEAKVSGFREGKKKDEFVKEFSAQLVGAKSAKVIAKIPVRDVKLPAAGAPSQEATLRGSLASSASSIPGPGAYKINLLRNGEVLASAEVALYRSQTAPPEEASHSGTITAGGTAVTIDKKDEKQPPPPPGDTTGLSGDLKSRFAEKFGPGPDTSLPPSAGTEVEPPEAEEQQGLPPSQQLPEGREVGPGDLPPPAGGTQDFEEPAAPPQVEASQESFAGKLVINSVDGIQETHALNLSISFNGEQISGSAEIEGHGTFTVHGTVHMRGLVLNLNGDAGSLRFSGARRGASLRGTYAGSGPFRNGSWSADRR